MRHHIAAMPPPSTAALAWPPKGETMPGWQGSNRRAELPPNWRKIRRAVAERANWRCQNTVGGLRCPNVGSHCDHIQRGNNHDLDNLRWLCPTCHNAKSGREGAQAKPPLHRPPEPHPGLRR